MHVDAPAAEAKEPTLQAAHCPLPVSAVAVPGGQGELTSAVEPVAGKKVPAATRLHEDAPSKELYDPAGHAIHAALELPPGDGLKVPALQKEAHSVVATAVENVPGRHCRHAVRFVTGA